MRPRARGRVPGLELRAQHLGRAWIVGVKKLADYGLDDHPDDDPDRAQAAWAVAALDDCGPCGDVRVELTLEEVGRPGAGVVAHLAPQTAKRLASALNLALRDIGEGAH